MSFYEQLRDNVFKKENSGKYPLWLVVGKSLVISDTVESGCLANALMQKIARTYALNKWSL